MKPPQKFVPELLAPAGNMEKLETAVRYGADAVYMGGGSLNLRAGAHGFSFEKLGDALKLCRDNGVKAYFTLNAMPREDMLPEVEAYLDRLDTLRPDGVIASDPGVMAMIRRRLPDMPLHVSTQANTCNSASVRFWKEFGAKRVNVAREVRSQELLQMLAVCRREIPDMALEVFVHGAQCMAISGRCYMSAYLNDRPGNLGQCSHPCRYEYRPASISVEEATRPGEDCWVVQEFKYSDEGDTFTFEEDGDEFTFHEDETETPAEPALTLGAATGGHTTFFAAQDLCLLHYLEWFSRMGVASIKLEGRGKSSSYLAQVVNAYRTALDHVKSGEFQPELYMPELVNAASRPLTTGFFDPDRVAPIAMPPLPDEKRPVLGRLGNRREDGRRELEVKARWDASETVEILVPGLDRPRLRPGDYRLESQEGEPLEVAHPGMRCLLRCDHPQADARLFVRSFREPLD
jgi:putative protease